MEIAIQLKDILFLVFLVLAVYISYRQGAKAGLEMGIDGTLAMIEDKGFIKVVELSDGEIQIIRNES
jgi:hypothetical protein|tara:strand:- start:6825 stop:7025 length:201 start_codon:yes stop_codon:yes gene_type:complete